MILTAFRRNPHYHNIHALYGMIVAQARSRAFYANYGVPNTVQGRFDSIVLHLVLISARLSRDQQPGPDHGSPDPVSGRAFCRDPDARGACHCQ